MTRDPTCREIVELVTEYLEGTMSRRDRAAFERHLAGCEGCSDYLDQMRAVIRLSARPVEESLSPELQLELVEAFRDLRRA